jgi:hypothetical protein
MWLRIVYENAKALKIGALMGKVSQASITSTATTVVLHDRILCELCKFDHCRCISYMYVECCMLSVIIVEVDLNVEKHIV